MPPTTQNPLLSIAPASIDLPFAQTTAAHVNEAVDALIAEATAAQRAIVEHRGARTFETTLAPLDALTARLDVALGVVGHLESVASTPEIRAAWNAVQPAISDFYGSIALDEGLHRALKDLAASEGGRSLGGVAKRYLDKTIADFRRNGAELDDAGKERLRAIDAALAQETLTFAQTVVDASAAFELLVDDEATLSGLPDSARAAAKQSAEAKGRSGFRFTLQGPSYLAVMTYADDADLRRRIFEGFSRRADPQNRARIRSILRLRREKARLLGYRDFADLVLEDRMAGSGQRARAFVADLTARVRPHADRERDELVAFAREFTGDPRLVLRAWDVAYFAEKQRKARYDFDEEALRPYFALDRALGGLFEIVRQLYGVVVTPLPGAQTADPSVRAFRMHDESGAEIGAFHVDVFPRENKRDGAWMSGLVTATDTTEFRPAFRPAASGKREPSLEVLVANVTSPIGGAVALLTHREIETLFHEMGHLMHHALSRVPIRALAGISVAWDFVELPSMIMENWCWERQALDLFARHHITGETIPDALFAAMTRARSYRAASAMMRQLGLSELDLALHLDVDPETTNEAQIFDLARTIAEAHGSTPLPDDYAMIASFQHVFGAPVGYAAGYYSYKWAEVLQADAFSRFAREGVLARAVGEAFRDEILARGDADDAMKLFSAFMGREPTVDALLERAGLQ